MSKDIRSYFVKNEKNFDLEVKTYNSKNSKKRIRRILDSDEEDEDCNPSKLRNKKSEKCPEESSKNISKSEVVVQVENFFGHTPVLQKKSELNTVKNLSKTKKIKPDKSKKKNSNESNKIPQFENDDELDKSLLNTDEEFLLGSDAVTKKKKTEKSNDKSPVAKKKKKYISELDCSNNPATSKKESVIFLSLSHEELDKKEEKYNEQITELSDKKPKKSLNAYHRYLQRPGPKNPGSKKIPQGSPLCLQGLAFVITGILDSLERDEAIDLIQKYGGRVTTQISKKTNYVIVGEEPGESKIQKADKFRTPKIDENALFDLIIQKSNHLCEEKKNFIDEKPKQFLCSDPIKSHFKACASSSGLLEKHDEKEKINKFSKSDDELLFKTTNQEEMLWVEKYKPKSTKNVIGQNGDKSSVKKLLIWLQNWHKNHFCKTKMKPFKPTSWVQNDDGSFFKAALLSGPPGVGKTTSVHLVCQELNLDVVEFNASDTRSKKSLQEEVTELLSSKSLKGFLQDNGKSYSNQVLVMDEIDGMAGNEDRGGIQEFIQLVKNTKIPIIGICNDRNHPKIRSLINYCFDLRFQKPPLKQIKATMMSICFKEKVNISGDALEELIISSNHDLRQVLHKLSLLFFENKSLSLEDAKKNGFEKKPINLGPWDVVRKVFSASDEEKTSLGEKIDLFFQDYSLGPLFVQDSYLNVKPHKARNSELKTLELISKAADNIALGDVVEKVIRSQSSWNLLPVQAVFSSVFPGYLMSGHFTGKIEFPIWLGKNSKTRKTIRILQELYTALSTCISGDDCALLLDYLQIMRDFLLTPLIVKGIDGVQESVKFMVDYGLLRENLDHILELSSWPGFKDEFSKIESKVKSAFTRALNKECQKASCVIKKVKISDDQVENEEGNDDLIDEEIGNLDSDPMIKKGKIKLNAKRKNSKK